MAKKLILTVKNSGKLISFLKKFSSIDDSLLIELDGQTIKAKAHTPDRALVKYSSEKISGIFETENVETPPVLFGIFNIDKFISSIKNFENEGYTFEIEYDVIDDLNIGIKISLKSNQLKIYFDCASYRLFTHISDELFFERIAAIENPELEFELEGGKFSNIISLSGIDASYKFLSFRGEGNAVYAEGQTFSLKVYENDGQNNTGEIPILKNYFGLIDKETSKVRADSEKIVFASTETNTIVVIGKSEKE